MADTLVFDYLVQKEVELDWQSSQEHLLLNPQWPAQDIKAIEELIQKVPRQPGHIWLATSGSSAESLAQTKIVAISKTAFLVAAESLNQRLKLQLFHKWGLALPLFHVGGLSILARAFLSHSSVVSLHNKKRSGWDAASFVAQVQDQQINVVSLVPTQIFDLVQAGLRAPLGLEYVLVGGAFLDEILYFQARLLGWPLLPCYGMTETCALVAIAESMPMDKPAKLKLLPHVRARVNLQQRLEFSGASLFTGYAQWQQKEAKFWDPKLEGWFTSEDQGEVLNDELKIWGRDSDAIKILGELTNLSRLRHQFNLAVMEHDPSLAMNWALVAQANERMGQELVLYIVGSREKWEPVMQIYETLVAPFERIKKYQSVAQIPRSQLGKILYKTLRDGGSH